MLFGEFGNGKPIEDPYYGGKGGFETTYKQVLAYSQGLLDHILAEESKESANSK